MLIELFSLDVTAKALRTNIDWKSAFLKGMDQFWPKFLVTSATSHFCTFGWASKCRTTFSLTVFPQRNFVADFLQVKCNLRRQTAILFLSPLGGLGATYAVYLRLIVSK